MNMQSPEHISLFGNTERADAAIATAVTEALPKAIERAIQVGNVAEVRFYLCINALCITAVSDHGLAEARFILEARSNAALAAMNYSNMDDVRRDAAHVEEHEIIIQVRRPVRFERTRCVLT